MERLHSLRKFFKERARNHYQARLIGTWADGLENLKDTVIIGSVYEKAVVGTHISGMEQALGLDYKEQVLVTPNDYEAFSQKILGVLRDPELREEIGRYNKARILSGFSVRKMADNHLKLIQAGLNL